MIYIEVSIPFSTYKQPNKSSLSQYPSSEHNCLALRTKATGFKCQKGVLADEFSFLGKLHKKWKTPGVKQKLLLLHVFSVLGRELGKHKKTSKCWQEEKPTTTGVQGGTLSALPAPRTPPQWQASNRDHEITHLGGMKHYKCLVNFSGFPW